MSKDHIPPPTPQELVSQMKEKYKAFLSACEVLSPEQALEPGICGDWSAKAVVDHLTGWQIESLPIVKQLLASENEALNYDIDAFNRTSVKSREDLTWDESLAALKSSFQAFDQALGEISASRYRTNEGFKSWLKAMSQEYQFHLKFIEAAHHL